MGLAKNIYWGETVESDSKCKAMELRAVATRLLALAEELDPGSPADAAEAGGRTTGDVTRFYAEMIFRNRQRRAEFFPNVPFADPAWDLLLDLYHRTGKGEVVTVTNACMAAGVPTTTALRWIDILIDLGLVIRGADVADRRRTLLRLTDPCREKLRVFLSELIISYER